MPLLIVNSCEMGIFWVKVFNASKIHPLNDREVNTERANNVFIKYFFIFFSAYNSNDKPPEKTDWLLML